MATKTFKTRIKLKYDLQSNWESPEIGFIPLPGELLLGKNADTPTKVYANVGIEDGRFLPLSVDGNYVDITAYDSNNVTIRTAKAAISDHGNRITALETAVGTGGSVAGQITDKINTLDVAVFQLTSVSNEGDIVISAISEVDGKIQAETGTTIAVEGAYSTSNPLVAKSYVDSIQSDLSDVIDTKASQAALTALEGRVGAAEGEIDTLQSEMDAVEAKAAANEAAIATKANQSDLTALTGRVGTAETKLSGIEDNAEVNIIETVKVNGTALTVGDDRAVNVNAVTQITVPVGGPKTVSTDGIITLNAADFGLSNALHFLGVTDIALSDESTTNPITIGGESKTAVNGDVVLYGNKEFVFSGGKWHELGDASTEAAAITTLQGRMDTAEGEIDALQTLTNTHTNEIEGLDSDLTALKNIVDTAEGEIDTLQSEMDDVEAKASENETAISGLDSRLTTAEGGLSGAISKNLDQDTAITALQGLVGNTAVATQITEAINGLDVTSQTIASEADGVVTLSKTITQNDGKIDIASTDNSITLAKVATTGDVNHLSQGTGNDTYIIFDCGTAEGWTEPLA